MSTASLALHPESRARLNPVVFFGSTALILILTVALILFPEGPGSG